MRKTLIIILISILTTLNITTSIADNNVEYISKSEMIDKLSAAAKKAHANKNFDQAIQYYHQILTLDPSIMQIRFLLARAYFETKNYDHAHYHFKLVQAENIPNKISKIIHQYLAYINLQKDWSVSLSGDITPESNINHGVTNQTVLIGGVPFTLNDDRLASRGVNLNAFASVTYTPKIIDGLYGHVQLSASANYLTGQKILNHNIGSELGLTLKQNANKYSAGIAYNKQNFDKKAYSTKLGTWATVAMPLSDKLYWSGRVSASKTFYTGTANRDLDFSIKQNFSYQHSVALGFNAAPSFELKKSFNKLKTNTKLGLTIGSRHTLGAGFTVNTSLGSNSSLYKHHNNIFAKTRKDLSLTAGIKVTNSQLKLFNFAPYIEYKYEKHKSNI
ncbi:MAG: tetratricopeptide repeat protein, partial [Rhizobiales bacterium]|nr:tetratricopeptide repeat protein [Hyphomicrobiales bacterium]